MLYVLRGRFCCQDENEAPPAELLLSTHLLRWREIRQTWVLHSSSAHANCIHLMWSSKSLALPLLVMKKTCFYTKLCYRYFFAIWTQNCSFKRLHAKIANQPKPCPFYFFSIEIHILSKCTKSKHPIPGSPSRLDSLLFFIISQSIIFLNPHLLSNSVKTWFSSVITLNFLLPCVSSFLLHIVMMIPVRKSIFPA